MIVQLSFDKLVVGCNPIAGYLKRVFGILNECIIQMTRPFSYVYSSRLVTLTTQRTKNESMIQRTISWIFSWSVNVWKATSSKTKAKAQGMCAHISDPHTNSAFLQCFNEQKVAKQCKQRSANVSVFWQLTTDPKKVPTLAMATYLSPRLKPPFPILVYRTFLLLPCSSTFYSLSLNFAPPLH